MGEQGEQGRQGERRRTGEQGEKGGTGDVENKTVEVVIERNLKYKNIKINDNKEKK